MRDRLRQYLWLAAVGCLGLTTGCTPPAQEPQSAPAPVACADLAALPVADTVLGSAEVVAAGTFEPPVPQLPFYRAEYSMLPAFCRVTGSIRPSADSDIRFELWLPVAGWNGKFMQTGNGGAAGFINYSSLVEPLSRGYAVAHTDTGHEGEIGDFSWAAGHPEKMVDFQYRAVHALTVVGKTLTEAHYGRAPVKSYWSGCSTGGRQGLKEAQRFPDDYDAILAGAPASNWSPLMGLSVLIQRNLGPAGLRINKLDMLKEAAISACDADDGVADRVISWPSRCDFDPASLRCASGQAGQCLSRNEIAAAKRIYAGVLNSTGDVLFPGTGPGSESAWRGYASPQFAIGTDYFRNLVMKDPDWDPADFDVDADLARANALDAGAADAMDPDLSAFIARGGKLITYHGTTDGVISYGNSVNYYESVVAELGADAVEDSVRLYLVPGMDHCFGGEGAFVIDWLTALEQWSEQDRAPGVLRGVHPAGMPGAQAYAGKAFTRPVCPYPQVVRYTGSGDDTDAASFECAAP
jgi:Tannase and feruloyl esterase